MERNGKSAAVGEGSGAVEQRKLRGPQALDQGPG